MAVCQEILAYEIFTITVCRKVCVECLFVCVYVLSACVLCSVCACISNEIGIQQRLEQDDRLIFVARG